MRIFAPWADVTSVTLRNKGHWLVLSLRSRGGLRLWRTGTMEAPSGKRLRNTSLKLPHLVVGRPLADIADRLAGAGVPVDRPAFRLRTTQLERLVIGEALVLLLSTQKGHHTYQTVYFWSALALVAISFAGRRAPGWGLASVVDVNLLVAAYVLLVLLVPGPSAPTRGVTLFTLSLPAGGLLRAVEWPFTRVPRAT